jgi:hypothetical protein
MRFDGLYISRNTYVRMGVKEFGSPHAPAHFVVYFRYYRFWPDGTVLYRTSPVVPKTAGRPMTGPLSHFVAATLGDAQRDGRCEAGEIGVAALANKISGGSSAGLPCSCVAAGSDSRNEKDIWPTAAPWVSQAHMFIGRWHIRGTKVRMALKCRSGCPCGGSSFWMFTWDN